MSAMISEDVSDDPARSHEPGYGSPFSLTTQIFLP
jgi:hypothetical protein